jgi:hypothetical protein
VLEIPRRLFDIDEKHKNKDNKDQQKAAFLDYLEFMRTYPNNSISDL